MDTTGIRIFFGLPLGEGRPILNAIAARRFEAIKGTLNEKEGDYLYGHRTATANVADRFTAYAFKISPWASTWKGLRGTMRYAWACVSTWLGLQDDKIEAIWHERAGADHWYTFEKEWN